MNRSFLTLIFIVLFIVTGNTQTPLRIQESSYWIDETSGLKKPGYENRYQYDATGKLRVNQYLGWNDQKQKIGPISRTEYTYDEQGRESHVANYYYLNQSDTISSTRIYDTEYDLNGRIKVYSITEMYYGNTNVYTSTFFYTYSPEGCLVRMDYQARLNGTGSNDYTVLYTADSQCRTLLKQTSYTDLMYVPSFETFEYEGSNLVTNRTYSITNGDTTLNMEILYAYDAQNQKVLEVQTGAYKNEYVYDLAGRLINQKYYPWNSTSQQWDEPRETQYLYSPEGLLVETISFLLSYENGYYFKYTYEYNSVEKPIRIVYFMSFNFEDHVLEFKSEHEIKYRCDGEEISRTFYDLSGGLRKQTGGSTTVYMLPASCEQVTEQNFLVYPNPTTGPVTLVPAQPLESYIIRIFNSSGQFIREYTSDQGISPAYMDFGALPPGLYIITITGENYFASTRLVRN